MAVALGRFAGRKHNDGGADARLGEALLQAVEMTRGDIAVGDDGNDRPPEERLDSLARLGEQAFTDRDLVAARAEFNRDGGIGGRRLKLVHFSVGPILASAPGS